MNQTIVGTFDTATQAQQAAQKLAAAGFGVDAVDVSNANYTAGPASGDSTDYRNTSGPATEGAANAVGRPAHRAEEGISGFFSALFGRAEDDAAQRYQRAAQSPGAIVTVHCHSAEQAQQAAQILGEAGAVDVDGRAAATSYPGPGPATSQPDAPTHADGLTAAASEGILHAGQRTEQTEGGRLRAPIVEKPVEASVRLREEHGAEQRTPVDRPAIVADFRAFEEGQIELIELAERAVVVKEAYVVEEINLGKQVTEREETIRDTVRSTEVDVEQIPGSTAPAGTSHDYPARSNS